MKIIERKGYSGWGKGRFVSYVLFGRYWLHVNRFFRWPLICFDDLPF